MVKFTGWLYKIQKDQHGEAKVIFVVPQTDVSPELMNIPTEKELNVEIKEVFSQ